MSSMDENAMFKALLKNRPPQTAQISQKTETPIKKEVREAVPRAPVNGASSEDAMFKVLLKNRPQQQNAQFVQKPQVPVKTALEAPTVDIYENEKQAIETITPIVQPLQTDLLAESIKSLTASVSLMHGLMKTVIVPVLILILIVGIAILIKIQP